MPLFTDHFLYFTVKVNCVFYIIYQCGYKLLWNAISTEICVLQQLLLMYGVHKICVVYSIRIIPIGGATGSN